ncbi:hypothetical protein HWV62_7624 [Athelia sp. TMB]|nr:hypothetical protein HWV62_7624 [Athelia sp. TMB]
MEFPSPVGGLPLPSSDFAPSVVFAILYGLLLPLLVHRVLDRRYRNTLLINTSTFAIERSATAFSVVILSLRAVQARDSNRRDSKGLTTYMQLSIGMGFIGIAQDLVNLLRVVLVKSTVGRDVQTANHGHDMGSSAELRDLEPAHLEALQTPLAPAGQSIDNPRLRFRYRRYTDVLNLVFLAAIVPGVIGNSHYGAALTNSAWAVKVMRLRYASTSVALFIILFMVGSIRWASKTLSKERKRAVHMMYIVSGLMVCSLFPKAVRRD